MVIIFWALSVRTHSRICNTGWQVKSFLTCLILNGNKSSHTKGKRGYQCINLKNYTRYEKIADFKVVNSLENTHSVVEFGTFYSSIPILLLMDKQKFFFDVTRLDFKILVLY